MDLVSVYVPTTPNPTSGFFLMLPRHETVELDMTVDAALKYIVSMGVVSPAAKDEVRTRTLAAALTDWRNRVMRSCYVGQVSLEHLDKQVTLFGWVHRRRDHGGVIFIDLRDREGLAQVVCDPDRQETFATAERMRNEFCVRVIGKVRRRPAGTENATCAAARSRCCARSSRS